MHQDSGYMTDKRQTTGSSSATSATTSLSGKENVPSAVTAVPSTSTAPAPRTPSRRARKALHATWSTPGNLQVPGIGCDSISFLPETPVRYYCY